DVLHEAALALKVEDHAHVGDLNDVEQVRLGLALGQDLGVERTGLQAHIAGLDLGEHLVERGEQLDLALLGVGRLEHERALGVGGAKLALGLAGVLPNEALTVVVNTADDFEHLGLAISPDLDTVMYTLAGVANPETGWGRRDESWTVMETLAQLGGETWFRLGDKDLATHIERTRRLNSGER